MHAHAIQLAKNGQAVTPLEMTLEHSNYGQLGILLRPN